MVSVAGDTPTTTAVDGTEHTHTASQDATVVHDGQTAKAKDLKAGTAVRVTTHKDDKTVATHIESGQRTPAAPKKA